tara:strand:+ start:5453 stop:5908 length:456 start_codon:yes stop_codon:yes gene_type:complete
MKTIEKRTRKEISKNSVRNAKILVVNDGNCNGEVNAYLIKKIVTITDKINYAKKMRNNKDYDFISVSDTADDEANRFLEFMLNSSKEKSPKKIIKLLKKSLSSEVFAYAEIKRIKYSKKTKSSEISLLDKLEEQYKGSKQGLSKASEKLEW